MMFQKTKTEMGINCKKGTSMAEMGNARKVIVNSDRYKGFRVEQMCKKVHQPKK